MSRKKKLSRKQRREEREHDNEPMLDPKVKAELVAIGVFVVAVVSLLALCGAAGPFGSYIAAALADIFGLSKWIFPAVLTLLAAKIAWPEKVMVRAPVALGAFLLFASLGGFLNVLIIKNTQGMLLIDALGAAGGYFGLMLGYPLISTLGFWASITVLAGLVLVAATLTFNFSINTAAGHVVGLFTFVKWPFAHRNGDVSERPVEAQLEHAEQLPFFSKKTLEAEEIPAEEKHDGPTFSPGMPASESAGAAPVLAVSEPPKRHYKKVEIPLSLLEDKSSKPNAGDIAAKSHVIKKTLENFGIPVEMGAISVGPTVTQFALKPADGIKLSRITSLSQDLALSLAAHPIRIEAPIPGQPLVGIEVPNHSVAVVGLKEVIDSKEFKSRTSSLTFCLGKDVAGKPWIADLGRMPHMLVAGATGSGKSVCLNTIILSLLFSNGPDDLKLMLIDPKRVELPVYNGIPHLLCPAITEIPKIINGLKWALGEMDQRFKKLAEEGVRDIKSYNERKPSDKMPYIVIIIDELADLMVASAAEVETVIIRLAQLARAVGIHLVVATQRPSVDVITGLIKANITARIAFSVASGTDSRTILDSLGAEKLVGRGDSLFLTSDLSTPKRIQGCFVSDKEIRSVVDYLVGQLDEPVEYVEGITEKGKSGAAGGDFGYNSDGDDELLEEARDTVVRAGKASASLLQRRLKVGYARAARLLDLMEERGIIGPGEGAKPRQILVAPLGGADGNHYSDDDFDGIS
ncbi:MAG: hypothetical protein RLZZ324_971 [Candidatus Parcubacteria bacterium]|jgi:S-DNA-T family DNA segregation ATPase FtsK/SpoIIIE